jgi:hypothetical protein
MEVRSETARVDQELEAAQRDLRDTLEQFNRKVEQVEARFQPQSIIRSNPVALPLIAGVLGFFAGSDSQARPFPWISIGALLGVAFAAAHRGSKNGSNGTSE